MRAIAGRLLRYFGLARQYGLRAALRRGWSRLLSYLGLQVRACWWIMLASGLLEYSLFVWLSPAFLRRGFSCWRCIPDARLGAIVLGLTLAHLGVLIGAVVNPMFMQWFWTPVIGTMMGPNEVAMNLAQAKSVDESATSEGHRRERV